MELPSKAQVWFSPDLSPDTAAGGRPGMFMGGADIAHLPAGRPTESCYSHVCKDIRYPLNDCFSAKKPVPQNENVRVRIPKPLTAIQKYNFFLIVFITHIMHLVVEMLEIHVIITIDLTSVVTSDILV